MSSQITAGAEVTIKFRETNIEPALARVVEVRNRIASIVYLTGIFTGCRGLLRLPGWTRKPRKVKQNRLKNSACNR